MQFALTQVAPVLIPAGEALGVSPVATLLAYCYGNSDTNLIQAAPGASRIPLRFIRSTQASPGATRMQTVKQIIHDIADHLPEQATIDDAMQALYVRQKLERSLEAAKDGQVTSQEEMERRYLDHAR